MTEKDKLVDRIKLRPMIHSKCFCKQIHTHGYIHTSPPKYIDTSRDTHSHGHINTERHLHSHIETEKKKRETHPHIDTYKAWQSI